MAELLGGESLFRTGKDASQKKFYCLEMFPIRQARSIWACAQLRDRNVIAV